MLNCKQASELMSQGMDMNLSLRQRMSLKLHTMMCSGCSNFLSQISFLRKAASQLDTCGHCESMHLSGEAKKRIHEALDVQDKNI